MHTRADALRAQDFGMKGIQPRPECREEYAGWESGLVLRVHPGVIAPLDSALPSQSIWRHGYGATPNSMGLFSEDVNRVRRSSIQFRATNNSRRA